MIQKSNTWLEKRRQYITASDAAAVLRLNPYKKPLEVYKDKLGLVPPFKGNKHTDRGKRCEPLILDAYESVLKKTVTRMNYELTVSSQYPFLAASFDALVTRPDHVDYPLEVKCPSRMWDSVPSYYIPQLWVQMIVARSDFGEFVWAVEDDVHSFRVHHHSLSDFPQSNQWLDTLKRFHGCVLARDLHPDFW